MCAVVTDGMYCVYYKPQDIVSSQQGIKLGRWWTQSAVTFVHTQILDLQLFLVDKGRGWEKTLFSFSLLYYADGRSFLPPL